MTTRELADIIEQESKDCYKSSLVNASPYGESFHTCGTVLESLANKLRDRAQVEEMLD